MLTDSIHSRIKSLWTGLRGNWLEGVPRLMAHWKLDELSGIRVSGNDGTLNGDPTWRPGDGKIGVVMEFDGVGDYVEVEGYKGISGPNPRTVTAWVRAESNASSLAIVLPDKGNVKVEDILL